jgi:hypothetical protein
MSYAEFFRGRWTAAAHAVQSGIAFGEARAKERGERFQQTEPKHLRVGINAALCDHGSLVKLLIAKGVMTEEEYLEAIAVGMEEEKARYETDLGVKLG